MGEIKTIGITGASGFIGVHLSKQLENEGYTTVELNRGLFELSEEELLSETERCDAVINLAGAPINKRWTKKYKQILISSRAGVTQKLVTAINKSNRVKLLISAFAVGIYPSSECYDEHCVATADSFLGKLCVLWETEAKKVRPDIRCVITRFGIVMAGQGGAFEKMTRPFRMGLRTTLAHRLNRTSWIDIDDLIRAILFIIENNRLSGVFNLTAPHPFTQEEFAQGTENYYKTCVKMNINPAILKMLMGESSEILTGNICVRPDRLLSSGFVFNTPCINDFLKKTLCKQQKNISTRIFRVR